MRNKVFSGIDSLPYGRATDEVTSGCLVLEGGAFRGVYEEGVLDALMEAGINMECTIGVSAGAMNGMNYVSGQIGRSARINLRYRHDSRYVGLKALKKNKGIIGFDFAFEKITDDPFDYERFYRPCQRFIAVATNCLTAEPEYFEKGKCPDILEAVRASASLPFISKEVLINNIPYLDGGCSVKVPFKWALDQKFEKIVIIRTRPELWRYPEKNNKKTMPHLFYRSYPKLLEGIDLSHQRYNKNCDEMVKLKQEGRIFMICPSRQTDVERLEKDMEKLGILYYMGYNDAKNIMNALKAYLNK